ncbi:hypothetical protein sscle_03g022590 [Sclerotinia sclerotiorum 1980 UF-70]|uniref:SCP domain-containing protein n=1 Tax=Sclerotinia sclerotiorum (strain ATCC 18683 / 1980 / Ss-1) TaxID=665079 RepID=A0A1D9PY16_SCLS1|nr:hypothetical protein sscle_03g022590 [Sclerotinia sclerotiorum 1980 UF-70]
MFLSNFVSLLLFSDLARAWVSDEAAKSMGVETLVTFTSLTESDETHIPTPNPPETAHCVLVDTSTTLTSPSTMKFFFPLSLTATSRSLSENDSKAAPTTSTRSSPTDAQISEPPLSTQASPMETGFSTPGQFKVQILQAQNWYRAAHGAKPLVWNNTLADTSSDWVARCVWELESTPDIGKSFVSVIPTSVFGIINYLGLERQFYNWSDPGMNNSTKQFTQMVWKNTTQVGCAWNNCPPGSSPDPSPASAEVALFLLCQYYPKGNQGSLKDWSNNVGELESGNLGEGVVAVDGFGLSSSTGTSSTSSTTSSSSAATGVDSQGVANMLHHSLFEVVVTSAFVIGLVAVYPSIMVPLLAFGFADATSQVEISASLTGTQHMEAVSKPTITPTFKTRAPAAETVFRSSMQFQSLMLEGVNWYRYKFDTIAIVWDESIASDGEAWQYVICQYYPPGNPDGLSYDDPQWVENVWKLGWEALDEISDGISRSSLFTNSVSTKTATKTLSNHPLDSTTSALTTSTTATISSIESAGIASTFERTFFTMIISLMIACSITTHPSVLISFLLSSSPVIAMPQSDLLTTKSSTTGPAFSSNPLPSSKVIQTSTPISIQITATENLNAIPISAERFVTIIPRPSQTTTNDISRLSTVSVTYTPYVSGHFNMPTLNTQAQPWQTGYSSPTQFQAQILWGINWYRGLFKYDDLIWNDTIAGWSADWVHCCDWNDTLVVTDPDLGSTSFMAINLGGMSDAPGVLDVVNAWGAESVEYYSADGGPKLPTFPIGSIASDDFTQTIWNGTTQVGCGWNNCPAGSAPTFTNNLPWQFTFCQYYPQGNIGDTKSWYNNIQPINSGIISQLVHGITSNDALSSVASTTTTMPGHHSSTITTTGTSHTSTNGVEKLDNFLLVVVIVTISSVAVVLGLV